MKSDVAHWKCGTETFRVVIQSRFIANTARNFSRCTNPFVPQSINAVGEATSIEVSTSPKPIPLSLHGFVQQPARDLDRWSVQPRHHQHSIRGIKSSRIGRCVEP